MATADEMRLDELARRAGIATTTVRLYHSKGLLPGPRLAGRTGYYDQRHLARLQLIARLQDEGFSLAGIARLLETWERGDALDDLLGAEGALDALLAPREPVVVDPADLVARFPAGSVGIDVVERAIAAGLVEPTDDGRLRVPDGRFLEAGAALAHLGVPVHVALDEWGHLVGATADIARRFAAVFEDHLLPTDPARADADQLAATLVELRKVARQVVLAALDQSLAAEGARRLGAVLDSDRCG